MIESFVDLHLHTVYSDGSLTPEELVNLAKIKNISAISITDHDNVDGIMPAVIEASKAGIELVPGIELSVESKYSSENELHILGYFIDWESKELRKKLIMLRRARLHRAYRIINKLKDLQIDINKDEIFEVAGKGSIGRLHFAKVLCRKNYVKNIKEAFQKYLSFGKPAYEPKLKLQPEDAIRLISNLGGIPVLAHPFYSDYTNSEMILSLIDIGLKGIEVWHNKQSKNVSLSLLRIAHKHKLLITGGSDYHGPVEPATVDSVNFMKLPYRYLLEMKKFKLKFYGKRIDTDIHR